MSIENLPPPQLYILLAITVTTLSIAISIVVLSGNEHLRRQSATMSPVANLAVAITYYHVFLALFVRMMATGLGDLVVFFSLILHIAGLIAIGELAGRFLKVLSDPQSTSITRADNNPL